ncbi:MAG: anthranilate phosphoribosyltransferase [Gemmatimonadales bacterium]|jgi:anthranilate phosphoribosyltransferase|nr:MAG: anthranilate phosphoribosyltransferase [Gemmatimonadales bacterium]
MDEHPVEFPDLIRKVTEGEHLDAEEAEAAFDAFLTGEATPVVMAALLAALRTKGVRAAEVAGGVRALQKAMRPVASDRPDELVDTAGTGGGSLTTFNISTAAALVAAGAGVRMAKHGNRSYSSRSGSADVLEALGVRIELDPEHMGEILAETGIVFMFAPILHPAMRHVGPVRRELRIPTIMNLLGPLTNPAGARRQVVGVADPRLISLVIGSLAELGHHHALVVHGFPGMDELSPLGSTRVAELDRGTVEEYEVSPEELGVEIHPWEGLAGGEPEDNARLILEILEGRNRDAARSAVLLNAGAAVYIAGKADSLKGGVLLARESVDSGQAREKLEQLRSASRR